MHELEVLQGEVVGGRGDGGGGGATLELASPLPHEASGAGCGVLKIQLFESIKDLMIIMEYEDQG